MSNTTLTDLSLIVKYTARMIRVFAWSKSGRRVSQVRAEKPNRKSVVAELGTTLEMRKRLLPYVANSLNL